MGAGGEGRGGRGGEGEGGRGGEGRGGEGEGRGWGGRGREGRGAQRSPSKPLLGPYLGQQVLGQRAFACRTPGREESMAQTKALRLARERRPFA